MARPPGKRNSTISQLSGGEKALTAVALVFSIFDLNPAPFCLLDEVDAPLDDHNVGRFCDIVREMSRSVQFIFITHNKSDHGTGLAARRRDHERARRVAPGRGRRRRGRAHGGDVGEFATQQRFAQVGRVALDIVGILGILAIGAIWLWSARGSRQAPGNAELREPTVTPRRRPTSRGARVGRDRREWGVPPLEPLSIRTADFAEVPALDQPMLTHADPVDFSLDSSRATGQARFIRSPTAVRAAPAAVIELDPVPLDDDPFDDVRADATIELEVRGEAGEELRTEAEVAAEEEARAEEQARAEEAGAGRGARTSRGRGAGRGARTS